MKKLFYFISVTTTLALLASCSSTGNLSSSFGKRKYLKGIFTDRPGTAGNVIIVETKSSAPENKVSAVYASNNSLTENSSPALPAESKKDIAPELRNNFTRVVSKNATHANETRTITAKDDESQKINASSSPLSESSTTVRGGSTSRASVYGCILALVGCVMAVAQIGWVLVPVICLIGLLLCIHGLLKRDYKTLAVIGIALSIFGMAYWIIGILNGALVFSVI